MSGEAITGALALARYLLSRVPSLLPHVRSFWGDHDLGPLPPELGPWEAVDAKIDAEMSDN